MHMAPPHTINLKLQQPPLPQYLPRFMPQMSCSDNVPTDKFNGHGDNKHDQNSAIAPSSCSMPKKLSSKSITTIKTLLDSILTEFVEIEDDHCSFC